MGEYTPPHMFCIKKHVLELENLMIAPGESFQALQDQTEQNPIHNIAKTIVLANSWPRVTIWGLQLFLQFLFYQHIIGGVHFPIAVHNS